MRLRSEGVLVSILGRIQYLALLWIGCEVKELFELARRIVKFKENTTLQVDTFYMNLNGNIPRIHGKQFGKLWS